MKYLLQITKALAANDVHVIIEPKNDIEALDIVRDLKDSADDGWRMIPMRAGLVEDEVDIETYELRTRTYYDEELEQDVTVTAKAELHTTTESSGSMVQYDTLAEAVTAIGLLDDSDGFMLVDDYDQQPKSKVVYHRPSLWKAEGEFIYSNGRLNNHSRTENDRI